MPLLAAETAPAGRHGPGGGGGGRAQVSVVLAVYVGQVHSIEQSALILVLVIAIAGLVYALMLVRQVKRADQGTAKMQEIAAAVREGANAYLGAQFRKIGPLIVIITIALFLTK